MGFVRSVFWMIGMKQKDMERAIRAAVRAGVTIGRVEIRADGTLVIVPRGEEAGDPDLLDSELEQWRRSHATH